MVKMKRSQDEIDLLYVQVFEDAENSETNFPSSTYEQGIKATIEWLMGSKSESPIESDETIS